MNYKEICEIMKIELQCSRCGCKRDFACVNCQFSFNHWKECYEEAKQILIKRNQKKEIHKATGKSADALDKFLREIDL